MSFSPAAGDTRPNGALLALLLVALTFFVYWPGLHGGFVFDDMANIVNNTALHVDSWSWDDWLGAVFSSPSSSLQRPLAMLSFAVNHYFTGLDPWPMKLTNIAIHAANALLALALVRAILRAAAPPAATDRAGAARWAPLFAASSWALHPINLMAVLFVVQRMESLAHVFVLAGLWLYATSRERQLAGGSGWARVLAALGVFTALGTLAKESAVLLPLYAFCMELCLYRFAAAEARVRVQLKWLYGLGLVLPAIVGIAWLLPHSLAPGAFSNRSFSLVERLMTEFRVVIDYLRWTLYPDLNQLSLYHDDYRISHGLLDPPSTLLAMAGVAMLAAAAWWLRRRRPVSALGISWFLSAQALTATFIPLELVFEHRNYFASFGICLVLADLLLLSPRSSAWRKTGAAIAAGLLLLYAAGTWLRAREWDHPLHFAQSEVAKHPRSPRATYELARMLVILTEYKADSPHFRDAVAAIEAARLVPGSSLLPEQAGLILAARAGQPLPEAWWAGLVAKLGKDPVGHQQMAAIAALVECANIGHCRFPRDRMIEVFAAAMSRGEQPELLNLHGAYAVQTLGDPQLALELWREAVRSKPSEPQYHDNLSRLLIALGRLDEARAQIAELRANGRLGQYESRARRLEAAVEAAERHRQTPPGGREQP